MNEMMKYIALVTCSIVLLGSAKINEFSLTKGAWKKVDKSLSAIWPDIHIDTTGVDAPNGVNIMKMYHLKSDQEDLGYMVFADAPSRYDRFDFMIVYDKDFNILSTTILVYRENYGGEISSKRWLGQFEGKNHADKFRLDDDIVGISGATMSCRIASAQFKKITSKLHEMKVAGMY